MIHYTLYINYNIKHEESHSPDNLSVTTLKRDSGCDQVIPQAVFCLRKTADSSCSFQVLIGLLNPS